MEWWHVGAGRYVITRIVVSQKYPLSLFTAEPFGAAKWSRGNPKSALQRPYRCTWDDDGPPMVVVPTLSVVQFNWRAALSLRPGSLDSATTSVLFHSWSFWLMRLIALLFPCGNSIWLPTITGHICNCHDTVPIRACSICMHKWFWFGPKKLDCCEFGIRLKFTYFGSTDRNVRWTKSERRKPSDSCW